MSTFGTLFKVTTFGESHCKAVGAIVDGCPPGIPLVEQDIQPQLDRRRPGQSNLTTPRDEKDKVTILSGCEMGYTLGTPIGLSVNNLDQRPQDYSKADMDFYPRPSHADFTYLEKYGVKASSGGGRSSARETIGRVAAGAIAEKYLSLTHNVSTVAFVASVGEVSMDGIEIPFDSPSLKNAANYESLEYKQELKSYMEKWERWWDLLNTVTREEVDKNEVRCPDQEAAAKMRQRILAAKENKDSIGGTVVCVIRNVPVGLGEPCFDKLEAKLAHAMMSIPATKAFEIGSGFNGTCIPGHIHNDAFVIKESGRLGTQTNFSGGVQGGISNGENIYFRVAFKPPATIGHAQPTTTYAGKEGILEAKGRHDPCVVPRAVAIVEAMASLVIMDALMIQNARQQTIRAIPRSIQPPVVLTGYKSKEESEIETFAS